MNLTRDERCPGRQLTSTRRNNVSACELRVPFRWGQKRQDQARNRLHAHVRATCSTVFMRIYQVAGIGVEGVIVAVGPYPRRRRDRDPTENTAKYLVRSQNLTIAHCRCLQMAHLRASRKSPLGAYAAKYAMIHGARVLPRAFNGRLYHACPQ